MATEGASSGVGSVYELVINLSIFPIKGVAYRSRPSSFVQLCYRLLVKRRGMIGGLSYPIRLVGNLLTCRVCIWQYHSGV